MKTINSIKSKRLIPRNLRNIKFLNMALILLLLLNTNNISAQERNSVTRIPMDLSMMVPNIEVYINGKGPYRFDFDTGAGRTTMSTKIATDLGLKAIGQAKLRSPASDSSITIDIVHVNELSISDLQITEIDIPVMDFGDMRSVDGVLSIKDFSDYLITFNFPEKIVQLEIGTLQKDEENVIPYSKVMNGMIMSFEIQVNGTKKNVFFDTGFPVSFAFPLSIQDDLSFRTPPVESGSAKMVGASFKIWKAQLEGNIHLANIVFESPEIVLEDRPGDFITMGNLILKDFAVTIDQKNNLLRFEKKTAQYNSKNDNNNEFTGRYEGSRNITFENGELYLQRDGSMKFKLVKIDNNLYEMKLQGNMAPMNELPKVSFDRDDLNKVKGLSFIHDDGREEIILKEKQYPK